MKPKKEVEKKEYFRDIHFLYEILNKLKNVDEVKAFLKDLLTKSELLMFKRRWHIASLLDQGYDIRQTAIEAKASTSTVLRVKEKLKGGTGGLKLALERTREGRKKLKPEKAKSRPAAKWIFGKSE